MIRPIEEPLPLLGHQAMRVHVRDLGANCVCCSRGEWKNDNRR